MGGRAPAEQLGARLAEVVIDAVLASPRQWAIDTAAPIVATRRSAIEVVDGLRELDFGELEGRTYDDIASELPELWSAWMRTPTAVRFPGGESYDDLRVRVHAAVSRLVHRHQGRTVLAVTHGGVARSTLAAVLGMPNAHIFRIDQRYGAINVIDFYHDGTPLVRLING